MLFMAINMNLGGTEKSLLNLLHGLNKEEHDITLLLLEKSGLLLSEVPHHVKIESLEGYKTIKPYIQQGIKSNVKVLIKSNKFKDLLHYTAASIATKITGNDKFKMKFYAEQVSQCQEVYDVAVAYAGPMDFISFYIAEKVDAKTKYQWIHFDVDKIGFSTSIVETIYPSFTKIYTVSKEGKAKMTSRFPFLEKKLDVSENRLSPELIKHLGEETGFLTDFKGIRILTVGRLSNEKGQDRAFPVLNRLVSRNIPVKWYFIGEGPERKTYEAQIKKYGLENQAILLGAKLNPYPFMRECDLYVQPSKHEGFCITLSEAKVFNVPIIATDFTGAKEQLNPYGQGQIVSNTDTEEFIDTVCERVEALWKEKNVTTELKQEAT